MTENYCNILAHLYPFKNPLIENPTDNLVQSEPIFKEDMLPKLFNTDKGKCKFEGVGGRVESCPNNPNSEFFVGPYSKETCRRCINDPTAALTSINTLPIIYRDPTGVQRIRPIYRGAR